jgi:hypothetical protein
VISRLKPGSTGISALCVPAPAESGRHGGPDIFTPFQGPLHRTQSGSDQICLSLKHNERRVRLPLCEMTIRAEVRSTLAALKIL